MGVKPALSIGTATGGYATYINCSVDVSATSISLERPDKSTVILCKNTIVRDCQQQAPGYMLDLQLSSNSNLVMSVMKVGDDDAGNWTCRTSEEISTATLKMLEPECSTSTTTTTQCSRSVTYSHSHPFVTLCGIVTYILMSKTTLGTYTWTPFKTIVYGS